mgnify:CR=1 FL=1
MGEHMLDRAADFRFLSVGDAHTIRHQPARRLLEMDARHEPAASQRRLFLHQSAGRIRSHVAGRVRPIGHVFETCAIMRGRVRRRPIPDQAEATIDRGMVLVAERGNGEVD